MKNSLDPQFAAEVATEAAKSVPPVTVAAVTLNDALVIASLAYVALQAAFLVYRWWRIHTGRDKG